MALRALPFTATLQKPAKALPIQVCTETPRCKGSQSQSCPYGDFTVKKLRKLLTEETQCHEVPVDFFLRSVLPDVPHLDTICATLRDKKVLRKNSWPLFSGKLPDKENKAFNKPMEKIVTAILDATMKVESEKRKDGELPVKGSEAGEGRGKGEQQTEEQLDEEEETMEKMKKDMADPVIRLVLRCDGNRTLLSERPDSHKPDGSLGFDGVHRKSVQALEFDEARSHLESTAVCMQFKFSETNLNDLHDNYAKILFDGLTLMKDPCRRFTFGLTIEGRQAHFYFFSRAFVMRSRRLDINKNHKDFIRFFAALAIATDEQLGWDNSIYRVIISGRIQYRANVDGSWYQTERVITDFRTNEIVSRGTRVWEVRKMRVVDGYLKVDPADATCVLKDVWMDCDEKQEAITIKRLRHILSRWREAYPDAPSASECTKDDSNAYAFEDAWLGAPHHDPHAFDDDAEPQFSYQEWGTAEWDRYFPCVLAHGFVKLDNKGDDSARNFVAANCFDELLDGRYPCFIPPDEDEEYQPAHPVYTAGSTWRKSISTSYVLSEQDNSLPLVAARTRDTIHYREILKHVGTRLDEVRTLDEVFKGLEDAAIGLRWLFRAGHIHRDLSLGNLLSVEITIDGMVVRVVQLTDFEYCRLTFAGEGRGCGMKMGTVDFMSAEVERGEWTYVTDGTENEAKASNDVHKQVAIVPIPEPPPFTNTPLHDLEPLFWMIIWTLVVRYSNPDSRYHWQGDYYRRIFHPEGKLLFITSPNTVMSTFMKVAAAEHNVLGRLKPPLKAMATLLTSSFMNLENNIPGQLDSSAYADYAAPNLMVDYMRQLCKALGNDQLLLYPEPRAPSSPPANSPKKRAHSEVQAPMHQQLDRKVKKPRNVQQGA